MTSDTTSSPPGWDLHGGDALDLLGDSDTLPDESVHAIVCDPPYAIDFMGEDWDQFRRKHNEADVGRDDFGGRLSSSAPASGAEGNNLEYQRWCTTWAQKAKRVLKPGGHVIAFSGNRTHHRLMAGIEDAGYEIRDTITWHYGGGMPKGARLSTWLDGEEAEQWGDWRGQLKPATEFACLARAPLDGSSATQNQVEYGVGNLNVEACRIPTDGRPKRELDQQGSRSGTTYNCAEDGSLDTSSQASGETDRGRYPANVVLDAEAARLLDAQSGITAGGNAGCDYDLPDDHLYGGSREGGAAEYDDEGGASRFYYMGCYLARAASGNPECCAVRLRISPALLPSPLAIMLRHVSMAASVTLHGSAGRMGE